VPAHIATVPNVSIDRGSDGAVFGNYNVVERVDQVEHLLVFLSLSRRGSSRLSVNLVALATKEPIAGSVPTIDFCQWPKLYRFWV
jgi:hypothetical protein